MTPFPWQVSVEGTGTSLSYQLSDTINFAIDDAGVIYTLRNLDHEGSGGHYSLQVTAKEQGECAAGE